MGLPPIERQSSAWHINDIDNVNDIDMNRAKMCLWLSLQHESKVADMVDGKVAKTDPLERALGGYVAQT